VPGDQCQQIDFGLSKVAFNEVLRRIALSVDRKYLNMGHWGAIEPGIRLMIALRWLHSSRPSDMRDMFMFGRCACACVHVRRMRACVRVRVHTECACAAEAQRTLIRPLGQPYTHSRVPETLKRLDP